jgi:hypothetical protein
VRVSGFKSRLVWLGLGAAVPGVVVGLAPTEVDAVAAPGHDAAGCRPCRSNAAVRGRPLPFEVDHLSVLGRDPDPLSDRCLVRAPGGRYSRR